MLAAGRRKEEEEERIPLSNARQGVEEREEAQVEREEQERMAEEEECRQAGVYLEEGTVSRLEYLRQLCRGQVSP